jgi:AraC family transcriptional regulator, transcriptional activator of pobA
MLMQTPKYHFTIDRRENLLADVDVWTPATEGVFEPGHFHSYYELLIFKKGGGTHKMGNEVYQVNDFSIHVLKNNTFHELRRTTETDGFEIIFSEVFLNQLQQFDPETNYLRYFSDSHVINFSEEEFKSFSVYFNELLSNQQNKSIFYNLVSIIILKIVTSDAAQPVHTFDLHFNANVLALLNQHYSERPTIEFYASRLNMSLNTFKRHTKAAFGKSIIDMQNEKIIQEAKFLLSQKEKSIKEISFDFKFTDESHFSHFFKKHIGLTPSAFRRSS